MSRLLSLTVNGQQINTPSGVPTGGLKEMTGIMQKGIVFLIVVAGFATLFFLLWGGIIWITSGGDKAKLQAARQRIMYAIIGLVIVLLSFFIISVMGMIFGVNLLSPQIPDAPPPSS